MFTWLHSCKRLKLFTRASKSVAAGRFDLYLLEPLGFVLQLQLPGPAAEVRQSGGRAPTASRPLRLQFEHMQMLQFSTQVFYQLQTDTARRSEETQSKNKLRTRTNSVPNWWQTKGKKKKKKRSLPPPAFPPFPFGTAVCSVSACPSFSCRGPSRPSDAGLCLPACLSSFVFPGPNTDTEKEVYPPIRSGFTLFGLQLLNQTNSFDVFRRASRTVFRDPFSIFCTCLSAVRQQWCAGNLSGGR